MKNAIIWAIIPLRMNLKYDRVISLNYGFN